MDAGQTLGEGCSAARAQIRRFLSAPGGIGGTKVLPPRAHLSQCAACNAEYRALVEGVAKFSHAARESETVVDDDTRARHVRRSLIAADPRRKLRLPRTLLPLALIAVFAVLVARAGTETVRLRAASGGVFQGASAVDPGKTVEAHDGDGCSTGPNGHASLERGPNAIRFDPDSSFLVERLDQLCVRMFAGQAAIEGDATVLFSSGALETRGGSAHIAIDEVGGRVECVRGVVEYTDATGRHVLSVGEIRQFAQPRMAAERE